MAMPTFTMRELVESGVHFGHTTRLWNPKMKPFIFDERNGIHIINLDHTSPVLSRALQFLAETATHGGRILFVGTKNQARETIRSTAVECGQYYVNHRWLGGMITNWQTIQNSISRMKKLQKQLAEENLGLTKKELVQLTRKKDKLELVLSGIGEMGSKPDVLFVIDIRKEATAVAEAQAAGIPVIAIIDSNCSPEGIDFPIYGNDDSLRAIKLYCRLAKEAILEGVKNQMQQMGMDIGVSTESFDTQAESDAAPAKADAAKTPLAPKDVKPKTKPTQKKAAAEKTETNDKKAVKTVKASEVEDKPALKKTTAKKTAGAVDKADAKPKSAAAADKAKPKPQTTAKK